MLFEFCLHLMAEPERALDHAAGLAPDVLVIGQRFGDYAELAARLAAQGPMSLERIEPYRGQEPIAIPMPYRLALL